MTHSHLPSVLSILFSASVALVAASALGAPRQLRDATLDGITAGNANVAAGTPNDGAIVAGNSSANISVSGQVAADDSQASATAVNLVDAAYSAVANGVNLWDGNATGENTGLTVNQGNSVLQTGTQSAKLANYVRSGPNVSSTVDTTSTMTNQGSVDTAQQVLGTDLQGGEGISIAGRLNAELTGGQISASNSIDTTANTNGNTSVGGGLFSGSTSGTFNLNTTQTLTWMLPNLSLQAAAAGCEVELGSCTANGSYSTSTQRTLQSQGPIAVKNAQAKYIVVDGSNLQSVENYQVNLTGGTESDAKALNLVNASGSSVTDGVNVAYSTGTTPGLTLNQVNTVIQYH